MDTFEEFFKNAKYKKLPSNYFDDDGDAIISFEIKGIFNNKEFIVRKSNSKVNEWYVDNKAKLKWNIIRKTYDDFINNFFKYI